MTRDHHGHHRQEHHQHYPRPSSEDVPSTALSSPPPSISSPNDGRRTPSSQPSAAPAATTPSVGRGGFTLCTSLAVALCGLACLLMGWIYYSDGGGGGLRPQKQHQTSERSGLFGLSEARRRGNDSRSDGGGGGTRGGVAGDGAPSRAAGLNLRGEPQLGVPEQGEYIPVLGGGNGLTRRFSSFEEYASLEQSIKMGRNETLGVPIVASPQGPKASRSIPVVTIIGVQKGGTQNLRSHLLTHPLLAGYKGKEAHFFDYGKFFLDLPRHGTEWSGDGHDNDRLSPDAVGDILSAYADRSMDAMAPRARDTKAGVDSTPVYVFHPLVPYRIRMVLPRARFVLLLRDPTERYFSHLRMVMCSTSPGEDWESAEKRLQSHFHHPGPEVAKYLDQDEAGYEPYTALCRGEKAKPSDLLRCWKRLQTRHPLYRGLYADQLERWFRVFDREQILIVDSGEMFGDFTGTLSKVARHAGLPPHDFEYDARHQHSTSTCERRRPELFAKDSRYDKMLKDAKHFRDWYRPHNQRLFELLGREMPWE